MESNNHVHTKDDDSGLVLIQKSNHNEDNQMLALFHLLFLYNNGDYDLDVDGESCSSYCPHLLRLETLTYVVNIDLSHIGIHSLDRCVSTPTHYLWKREAIVQYARYPIESEVMRVCIEVSGDDSCPC